MTVRFSHFTLGFFHRHWNWNHLNSGSKVDTMPRALVSHRCVFGIISRLSLLLAFILVFLRIFFEFFTVSPSTNTKKYINEKKIKLRRIVLHTLYYRIPLFCGQSRLTFPWQPILHFAGKKKLGFNFIAFLQHRHYLLNGKNSRDWEIWL